MTNMSRKWWEGEGGIEEEEEALPSLDGDQKHAKKDGAAEKELELPK